MLQIAAVLSLNRSFGLLPAHRGVKSDGLYRWVRHPLYTAGLMFIWLAPLMSVNLLALNLGFSLYIVVGAYIEERKLVAEFGPAYTAYQRETPMLVPGLRVRRRG